MIIRHDDITYDLFSTLGYFRQMGFPSFYLPEQTSFVEVKNKTNANCVIRFEYNNFSTQLRYYFNLTSLCTRHLDLSRAGMLLTGRRFNMGLFDSYLWGQDSESPAARDKKELLAVFGIPRKEIKLLYELFLFYKLVITRKTDDLYNKAYSIENMEKKQKALKHIQQSTQPFESPNLFLNYIEYKIPQITIFVDKGFHSSKTKYTGLRKLIKQDFYDNPQFNYVVVDNIHNILHSEIKLEYKHNTNNMFEMEEKEKEDINQFKEYLINLCNTYEFGTTDKSKQTREVFQCKSDELFPYKRILQKSSSSSLLLGKHA